MALRTRAARKVAAVFVAVPLTLAPFAAAAPAAALPRQAAPNTVEAQLDSKFAPDSLTVPVGTAVTWIDKGGVHSVTGGDGTLDPASPIGDTPLNTEGETVTKTFDQPGTYPFFCTPHLSLGMKGVIVVTAAGAGASSAAPSGSGSGATTSATASPTATAGATVPAASAAGSAAPSGSNAASASAGAAAGASGSGSAGASVVAVSGNVGSPDPSLGAAALKELDTRLEEEEKPLTSFRLALWALTLGTVLLGAGIYFVTKPRREEA